MKLLPKHIWDISISTNDSNYAIVGIYEHLGYVYYQKIRLRDLPNNLISIDDLERFSIYINDTPPIGEFEISCHFRN